MDNIIKYGIGREYVPDWGVSEAIREIFQNFIDYGEYEMNISDIFTRDVKQVTLKSDYEPDNLEIFKIGTSIKSGNSIGQHGEGLKLALMILLRDGYNCSVQIKDKMFVPIWIQDTYLGEVFAIEIFDSAGYINGFKVMFECEAEHIERFKESTLTDDDIIYTSYYGDIINKTAGDIYVGGLFVCNLKGYNYAYNFKPDHVSLERDRTIPREYDIQYYASNILEGYDGTQAKDLISDDTKYINRIPDCLVNDVDVELENGEVVLSIGDQKLPGKLYSSAITNKDIRKKVTKLRYTATRKRKPYSFIKDFYDKHYYNLNSSAKIDYDVMMKKAKDWK